MRFTNTRFVKRPGYTLVLAVSDHKVPRLYVHKKRWPEVPTDLAARITPDFVPSMENWAQVDMATFAMTGNVRVI